MIGTYAIKEHRAVADLMEHEGHWLINRIVVPAIYRGLGSGSALLKLICADADKEQATLEVWPVPYPSSKGILGLSRTKLRAWYGRYGFVEVPNKNGIMMRAPKEKESEHAI